MDAPDDTSPHLTADASTDDAGRPLISIAGELDLASAPQLSTAAKAVLDERPDNVVFDLAGVEFMDSSGLRVLLEVAGQVDSVIVRRPSNAARRVIESAGVDQVFTLEV